MPAGSRGVLGRARLGLVLAVLWLLTFVPAAARTAEPLRVSHAYAGSAFDYQVRRGDTIDSLSARFGQGSAELARLNRLRRDQRLRPGQVLRIDNHHIVPQWLEQGILINIPQRMLFRFDDGQITAAYPVGLGKSDWPTPEGNFEVRSLEEDKTWFVPESIQEEMRTKGLDVKERVPPGPDNPLGRQWIGVTAPGIGIHGTIAPVSIYAFRSHGCIRLHPEDAERLYEQAGKGDSVVIIHEPAIVGRFIDGRIEVEVHRDAYRKGVDAVAAIRRMADEQGLAPWIDWDKVRAAADEKAGAMRDVSVKPLPANGSH
jgi:L,D-transpeptidase ErfK/SrfK